MAARILHVSDLHTGTKEDAAVEPALAVLVERVRPDLLVASGDLTHRARPEQHDRAARFLRSFGVPVLAVPGNHDIPWASARVTRPFAQFDRIWPEREPTFASPELHVVGLNSVRWWRQQSGGLRAGQLRGAAARLREAADGALRVVVLHHQLLGSPWRTRKKPLARRNHVLRSLVEAGAELIVGGHVHQVALSERREFEVVHGEARGVVVSTAPGLGQPRPSRLGEARGLHVYEATPARLSAATYIWRDEDWALIAERTFARGTQPLVTESAGRAKAP